MSRLFFAFFLSLTFLSGAARAEQTVAVRAMALMPGELPEVHVMSEDGYVPLEFSSIQPGEPVKARAANPLPLYQQRQEADGRQNWGVASQVRLPAGARGVLLLGWNNGGENSYLAINDHFTAARFNDWLLINASTRPIAFAVGENARPVVVEAGSSLTHRVSAPHGRGAAVTALMPVDGEPTVFYSTYWPVYEDRRAVVLFVDDGDRVIVRRIADVLLTEDEQESSP